MHGHHNKVALGLDIRSGQYLEELDEILNDMKKPDIPMKFCFWTVQLKY